MKEDNDLMTEGGFAFFQERAADVSMTVELMKVLGT